MSQRVAVLVASGDPRRLKSLERALPDFEVLGAADVAAALKLLAARAFNVVIADYRLGGSTGLELLSRCAAQHLEVGRVLASAYDDLPEIVAARAKGLRVVPLDCSSKNLVAVLEEVMAGAPEDTASVGRPVFVRADLAPLLLWSATRAARVRNVVVREPPAGAVEGQLQFVMPARTGLESFRQDLVTRWHLPLKQRDVAVSRAMKNHPLVSWLGELSKQVEIYCRRVDDGSSWAYVALLPWRKEPKVTCVMGVYGNEPDASLRLALLDAHAAALKEVATFPLPSVPSEGEASGAGQVVPEYDWVVTRSYAGRDRRRIPTAMLGRHAFVGQRSRVPSRIAGRLGVFADRLSRAQRRLLVVYAALALVDAVLTWRMAGAGRVAELNPAMAALLDAGPWWFFFVKNAVALGAFAIIGRFEHSRLGVVLMGGVVLLFALLDAWWVVLLLRFK